MPSEQGERPPKRHWLRWTTTVLVAALQSPAAAAFPPALPMSLLPVPLHRDDVAVRHRQWPLWAVLVLMAGAAGGLFLVERGSPVGQGATTAPSTTTTLAPTTTTTTAPAIPPVPQATPDAAAQALIGAWAAGNRTAASGVATPDAVNALFAAPYQRGLAGDRGCGSGASPVTCTFGPPGGANPNDPIYSVVVSQAPSGAWYVSQVRVVP